MAASASPKTFSNFWMRNGARHQLSVGNGEQATFVGTTLRQDRGDLRFGSYLRRQQDA
jgi:hypothetical protein